MSLKAAVLETIVSTPATAQSSQPQGQLRSPRVSFLLGSFHTLLEFVWLKLMLDRGSVSDSAHDDCCYMDQLSPAAAILDRELP